MRPRCQTMVGEVEYRIATDVRVSRPAEMVHLEFIQRDPRADRAVGIARVIAHPGVVADLIEQPSAVQGGPRTRVVCAVRVGRDKASVGRGPTIQTGLSGLPHSFSGAA